MAFKVTFLKGSKPLTKIITATKTENYPLVKKFTNTNYDIDNIDDFYAAMVKHAKLGECIAKGPISVDIKQESRAGLIAPSTATNWFVIDIDDASFICKTSKLDARDLETLSERVLGTLPTFLQDVSYISQASSSLGFKKDKISLHLFFLLDGPIAPSSLKDWLTNMNFEIDGFRDKLQLTKTGWDVKYTLDRCVADNARIIYIAPPKISGRPNPFKKASDRIIVVKKEYPTVAAKLVLNGAARSTVTIKKKLLFTLRKAAGLEGRAKAKFQNLIVGGTKTRVLLNPAAGALNHVYEARGYDYDNNQCCHHRRNYNSRSHALHKHDLVLLLRGLAGLLF